MSTELLADEDKNLEGITVTLDDDAAPPPAPETDIEVVTEAKADVVSADEGLADLRRQLEESQRRQKEEAEARRMAEEISRRAAEEATRTREEISTIRQAHESAELATLSSAIDAVSREADLATREYEDALTGGDYRKAAEAQRRMAKAEAKLAQLEDGKAELESRSRSPAPKAEAQRNAPAPQGDPVDAYIGQFSPRSQSWLRGHKQYVTDPKLNLRLIAAHNEAVADDHVPDSDAYFDFIETKLGLKTPMSAQTEERRAPAAASTMAAPPSRSASPAGRPSDPRKVTLSAIEKQTADDLGMSYVDYARAKMQLEREGKLGNHA